MFKVLRTYIYHFFIVSAVLLVLGAVIGVSQHVSVNYGDNPLAYKVGDEGPFIFYSGGQREALYIRGNRENGFSVDKQLYSAVGPIPARVVFNGDQSSFDFDIYPPEITHKAVYRDEQPILAISDLEGNYRAFRDFLVAHRVISDDLNWAFGQGHLVLVGDMVDRGDSTTQLLWFIYKLEQEARRAGGHVHYIIGNHELKNLQGNFRSAAHKYIPVAGILGKTQSALFGPQALIGKWLESKNSIEVINGNVFVHGGLHPSIADTKLDVEELNEVLRSYYRQMYYPGLADKETEQLISTQTGPAWYRGYFQDEVKDQDIENTLAKFDARAVIVGHTLQFSVNSLFNKKVFAIDVKHPDDYRNSFPVKHSEGLLIEGTQYSRLLDTGERIAL